MDSTELDKQRLQSARSIQRSAARLIRLIELNAPPLVLENERVILLRAVTGMPVETEYQLQAQRIHNQIVLAEQQFLAAHGFYKDVEGDMR